RPQRQPHGDPGVREREGRPDRLHAPERPRARALRDHRQRDRAGLRPLEPDLDRAVRALRRGGPAAADRVDRDPPARHPGGHRERRPLLRRRRVVVGDGAGPLDRWRPCHLLTSASATSASSRRCSRSRASRRTRSGPATCGARPNGTRGRLPSAAAASWRRTASRSSAPTLLVYGHYDVQPPGDERLWEMPPFEPSVRDGRIYARGATDDKGPVYVALKVAEAFGREPPVGVRFLLEGEEEIGSPSLPAFLERHREELAADLVVSA